MTDPRRPESAAIVPAEPHNRAIQVAAPDINMHTTLIAGQVVPATVVAGDPYIYPPLINPPAKQSRTRWSISVPALVGIAAVVVGGLAYWKLALNDEVAPIENPPQAAAPIEEVLPSHRGQRQDGGVSGEPRRRRLCRGRREVSGRETAGWIRLADSAPLRPSLRIDRYRGERERRRLRHRSF
ncbi:hypothetical protein [Antrihabitans stalactiti]|uniref:hypothetical protein n=1 Tax=Antrihabitans stalactiti TaxID=2584121 RepID=UPI001F0DC9DB|nr:hypothetical protein [Antrihabitans stalactiti]